MQVSVRELKSRLSHYLRLVRAGETVLVTSHDKPIARVEAVSQERRSPLDRLAAAGGVAWSGGKPRVRGVSATPLDGDKMASEIVLEGRE